MKMHNLNSRSFSQHSGIPYTTINSWYKKGYEGLKITTLRKLKEFFGTTYDYWLSDDIINPNYTISSNEDIDYTEMEHINNYRLLDDTGKKHINSELKRELSRISLLQEKDNRIKELESYSSNIINFNKSQDTKRTIQYFHKVSAGSGEVIFDDVHSEQISIPDIQKYRRVAYAVKVSGCSMEPLFSNGDLLLIEPTCTIDIGEIGIFNVNGQAYVKKLGETELISLNKKCPNVTLTEDAKCMGRVIDKYISEQTAALNIGMIALEKIKQSKETSNDSLG